MTKAEIIREVSKRTGIILSQTTKTFDSIIEVMSEALKEGEKITINSFGTFHVKEQEERTVTFNKDGKSYHVPKRKKIRFKQSDKFNE